MSRYTIESILHWEKLDKATKKQVIKNELKEIEKAGEQLQKELKKYEKVVRNIKIIYEIKKVKYDSIKDKYKKELENDE